jgi:predicted membrane protein
MVVKKNLVEFSPNSCTIFINYDYWFLLTFFIIIFISFFGFFSTLCLCFSIILVFYLYYARKKLKTENKRKKSILEINLMAIGVEEEKEFNFNKILFLNQIKFSDLKDLIGKLFFLIFFNF